MALKPFPRLVLIVATVGGIGCGLYVAKDFLAKGQSAVAASEAVQPQPLPLASQATAPGPAFVPAPAPAPAEAPAPPALVNIAGDRPVAVAPAPDSSPENAGMAKLLSSGAKK